MYFVYLPRSISQNQKRRMKKTRDYVLNLTDELQIPLIDLEKELFNIHPDPLSLIPFRTRGHLSKQGYYLVSEIISHKIKKIKKRLNRLENYLFIFINFTNEQKKH